MMASKRKRIRTNELVCIIRTHLTPFRVTCRLHQEVASHQTETVPTRLLLGREEIV